MKAKAGWFLALALLLTLGGAGYVAERHAEASRQLVVAVNRHDAPQVGALLGQGADPNVRDWETYYFDDGVFSKPSWYEKYLARLTRRKPHPTNRYVGPTMLIIAAHDGDNAVVQELLDYGADQTLRGTEIAGGNTLLEIAPVTPLWTAIGAHHTATALLLIERGAPVNSRFDHGITPLLEMYQETTRQPPIIAALLNHGADANAADNDGGTALQEAASCAEPATARLLLNKGANIEARNCFGTTPLMFACTSADSLNPVLPMLLTSGADVNARDRYGRTALINTAEDRNAAAMALLLSHGATVDAQSNQGRTALMWVSYARSYEAGSRWKTKRAILRALLLQHGANPHIKDKQGRTAADYEREDNPDASP